MTPDEIAAVAEVVDVAIARRMEEVYGTIEELRQGVADAVDNIRATAEVLHDNDTAIMGHLQARDDGEVGGFVGAVSDSWVRFLRGEMARLGWKVMVPK